MLAATYPIRVLLMTISGLVIRHHVDCTERIGGLLKFYSRAG